MDIDIFLKAIFGTREFSIMDQRIFDYYKKYTEEKITLLNKSRFINENYRNKYEFKFKYLKLFKINGAVDNYNNIDFLEINEGLIDRSCELAYKIVSFFPDLKNFNNIPERYFGVRNTLHMDGNSYNIDNYIPTKDEDKIIAEYMAMFAIKFVILHEMGHLYNGHVEYLKKKLNIKKLAECKDENSISELDNRTIEMDADAFAISMLVREIIDYKNQYDELYKVLDNENKIYTILAYGINIIFLLMEEDYGDKYSSKYLPLIYRRILAIDCIITNERVIRGRKSQDELIRNNIYNSFIDVQNCYYVLKDVSMEDREHFKNKILNYDNEIVNDVNKNWQVIRKELKNYTRLGLSLW